MIPCHHKTLSCQHTHFWVFDHLNMRALKLPCYLAIMRTTLCSVKMLSCYFATVYVVVLLGEHHTCILYNDVIRKFLRFHIDFMIGTYI
jgi:hypothetical protein